MTPREIYELLVGVDSRIGAGDFADFINTRIMRKSEKEAVDPIVFTTDEAEEILRELADLIAGEDEFDGESEDEAEELRIEKDLGEEEDDELPAIEGERIEEIVGDLPVDEEDL